MRFYIAIPILIYLHLGALSFSVAQDDEKVDADEIVSTKVRVVDPDGYPVEGAVIEVTMLGANADQGRAWPWRPDRYGPAPNLVTDTNGFAHLTIPKFVENQTLTDSMYLTASHPDYITHRTRRELANSEEEIKLQSRMRIAATAIKGETGDLITNDLYAVVSANVIQEQWTVAENGTLVSPVVSPQLMTLRIVKISDGEPILFSDLITIDPAGRSRIMVRDVKLWPGIKVAGTLAPDVLRPIRGGFVVAFCEDVMEISGPPRRPIVWQWSERADLSDDGQFVFESLPRDLILQLQPICDGWIAAPPTDAVLSELFPNAAIEEGHHLPQVFRLSGELVTLVLTMVPAAIVRANVTNLQGAPVPDADVLVMTSQYWFAEGRRLRGGGLYGTVDPTKDALINAGRGISDYRFQESNLRLRAKTNRQGVAVIKSVPEATRQRIDVYRPGFGMPESMTTDRLTVRTKSGSITEVDLQLQPLETKQ